jgi:hypothetical protein
VRRFVVDRSDFQRAWGRLTDWAARRRPQVVLTPERVQQLSSLFAAKDRASIDKRPPAPPVAPILTQPATAEPEQPKPTVRAAPRTRATPPAPEPVAGGTSSTLLAKKRAREKKE